MPKQYSLNRELKLPYLNSYLIEHKNEEEMIVATCEVASVITVVYSKQ